MMPTLTWPLPLHAIHTHTHRDPGHDAAQVGAHSIHSIVLQVAGVTIDDQVGGIALRMRRQ